MLTERDINEVEEVVFDRITSRIRTRAHVRRAVVEAVLLAVLAVGGGLLAWGGSFARDMVIAAVAFAYSVWAITGSGKDIIAKGFVLLLAGIPIYVAMKWWQTRQARQLTAALGEPATQAGMAVPEVTVAEASR